MRKKILLGCYKVPGYGGASTASYTLFHMMQGQGLDVSYMNLILREDVEYFRDAFGDSFGNPRSLAEVQNCVLNGPLFYPHAELADLIHDISPGIVLATGWIAALLMKRAAPEKRVIFITSGCQQMKDLIEEGTARDFVSLDGSIRRPISQPLFRSEPEWSKLEREAVLISDQIITHSDIVRSLFRDFFPSQIGKIHSEVVWFAEWIYHNALQFSRLQKPFGERDVDLLFIANTWRRPEKNYGLVKKIVSRCKGVSAHIVGEVEERCLNAEYHGFLARREDLFSLMGRAKTVVCPSLFDAAPGILFEASAMGCNLVASKNCGNWKICHEQLLVEPCALEDFQEKISRALSRRYEDHIHHFVGIGAYDRLLDALMAA